MSLHAFPGPLDHNVLYLGEEHRARKLWMEPEWGLTCDIDVKRGEGSFWDAVYKGHIYMADGVMNKVAEAGFKGVFDCGYRKIDRALIQALIERWRPETNTFHLPIGEVTVTLEDVGILWGLPVEGEPVTLSNNLYDLSDRIKMCRDYLGFTPLESDFKRHTIKISSILQHLMSNPLADEGADEEQYANQARCIILILCSSTLFADKSNAFASLSYLYNIRDIKNCGGLSWGSAALSCLYRELSKGTNPETIAVGGPMSLLQLWAWTRILPLAPRVTGQINIDPTAPYGARWDYSVSHKQSPSHVLLAHRTSLQNLLPNQFDWMPYRNVIHTLPQMCTSGMQSWMSQCYLIFWATIEYHPAERVMRQFGLVQTIPRPFPLSKETQRQLRKLDRTGRADMDWSQHHHFYINEWRNRHQYLVRGALSVTPTVDPQYNGWFNRITVLFVRNPNVGPDTQPYGFQDLGGTSRLLVEGLSYIGQEIPRMRNMGADNYYDNFSALENMTTNIMGMVGQSEAIQHHPHIQTDPVHFETDDTIPQRARRRPSTRGRRGSRDNNQNIAGPSSYQENRQNFGEGTSSFQVGQSNVYRPSFEHFGEGTSNFGEGISNYQQGTSLNVNDYPVDSMDFVSSLFDYQTPQQNIIRGISPNQSQHFQQLHQFQYTGDNEQQPRFRGLSPVHLELGLQLGQPEEGHEYQPEQVVGRRRQPPRNAGPPGCGTNDHHYTRHNRR